MDANHVDIFEVLRNDHRTLRSLLEQFHRTPDPESRIRRLDALEEEFEVHSAAEEEVIYPRLQEQESLEETASEAFDAHCAIRDGIDALRAVLEDAVIEGDEGTWRSVLQDLRDIFERHVGTEENIIFETMAKVYSAEILSTMRDDFLQIRRQLKQRVAA